MFVVGCNHLGRRKSTEKFELRSCRRSRSSHCQEPAVFSLILPFLSAAASERSSKRVEGVQSELKGI